MTSSELKMSEVRSKENIADKDRKQKEKSDERAAKAHFYGAALGALGKVVGSANDVRWYTKLSNSSKINASIPDFTTLGTKDPNIYGLVDGSLSFLNVPSVVSVEYVPSIGPAYQYASFNPSARDYKAINRALNRVATQLEQRNSRVSTYSRDTIGRYIFIASQIANDIGRIKTLVDVYDMAESTKPFISRQIIRAMGFNYDSTRNTIALIRHELNLVMHDFNESIPLPSDLTYVKRQLWLAQTIVKDSKTDYCSYLVFKKAVAFNFGTHPGLEDNYVSEKGPTNGYFPLSILTYARNSINSLLNGASWKSLIRDIRGGTKSNDWVRFDTDVTKKTVQFVDMDEVRQQIHNLNTLPVFLGNDFKTGYCGFVVPSASVGGNSAEEVVQSALNGVRHENASASTISALSAILPGSILWSGSAAEMNALYSELQIIAPHNIYNNYTKEFVIDGCDCDTKETVGLVYTRLKMGWTARRISLTIAAGDTLPLVVCDRQDFAPIGAGTYELVVLYPAICGTEVATQIKAFTDDVDNASVPVGQLMCAQSTFDQLNMLEDIGAGVFAFATEIFIDQSTMGIYEGSHSLMASVGLLSSYDWMPNCYVSTSDLSDASDIPELRCFGELDHYTTIDVRVLSKLHEQCVESLFTLSDSVYLKPLQ